MIGGYEPRRGQRLAGHRGYFLTGVGALLNLALVNYGVTFLSQRLYTPIQPPFFMKKEAMAKTSQLSDFDEQLYKV
jgi:seryl-tRNA synthetase